MPLWPVRFDLRVDLNDAALFRALVTCDALARSINGIPLPPDVRKRIDGLNIARTVRGTTGIEGARLTEDEVSSILAAQAGVRVLPASRDREEREARNAARVLAEVSRLVRDDPQVAVTEPVIRRLHVLMTEGIDYASNEPGAYRKHAVNAGDYVPPRDGDEVRTLMMSFTNWLNAPPVRDWHPVVRASAAHFYFISIHPFGDGNGRTARAIESLILLQGRLNAIGFYSLANFYYQNRSEYVRMLDYTRFESGGDLTPFVQFAAKGFVEELEHVHAEVIASSTQVAFRDFAREVLDEGGELGAKAGGRMFRLLIQLGADTVRLQDIRLGRHPIALLYRSVSARTLTRDVDRLEKLGLVRFEDGALRARFEIMAAYRPDSDDVRPAPG